MVGVRSFSLTFARSMVPSSSLTASWRQLPARLFSHLQTEDGNAFDRGRGAGTLSEG